MLKFSLIVVLLVICNSQAMASFASCRSAYENPDFDEKVRLYSKCIASPLSGDDRARAFFFRGNFYQEYGEYELALSDFSNSIEYDPKEALGYSARANLYLSAGKFDLALADYTVIIGLRRKTDKARAYSNRGHLLGWMGRYEEALADLDESIRLMKRKSSGYTNKALLLATCPDLSIRNGPLAIEFALKAVDIDDDRYTRGALAAAYAATGQFEEARAEQSKVVALILESEDTNSLQSAELRLALYEKNLAYYRPKLETTN